MPAPPDQLDEEVEGLRRELLDLAFDLQRHLHAVAQKPALALVEAEGAELVKAPRLVPHHAFPAAEIIPRKKRGRAEDFRPRPGVSSAPRSRPSAVWGLDWKRREFYRRAAARAMVAPVPAAYRAAAP
jgi:hypothetical protein